MDENEATFPMDITERDPSSRAWKFRPEGYLVVILSDADEARVAEAALVAHGFAPNDVKLYTGEQILANYEVYKGQRDLVNKIVGAVADDAEGRDLYLDYAREDRCALWMRIPNEDLVPKALRALADRNYLHTRYYGVEKHTDYRVS
jgi:hypothetical protein